MTPRARFLNTLHFRKNDDRLPMVEWAAWWDKTIERWHTEGMDASLDFEQSLQHFGLDRLLLLHGGSIGAGFPYPSAHGGAVIHTEADYKRIRHTLYQQDRIDGVLRQAEALKPAHDKGEIIIRLWLDGFFWHPRELLGIENHLFAFYDQPELMHAINQRLAEYNIRLVNQLCDILQPDMVGFAEDMSYNNGPMLSYEAFREFLLPYYRLVNPHIRKHGIKILVDSDGDITQMVPWLEEAGIDGIYPLEKQAGVDIMALRKQHPRLLMLGGFDKMVMHKGEAALRGEFERIYPVMLSGGYIPSVDHQTPPEVSLSDFRLYMRLFKEYAEKAAMASSLGR